MKIVTKLTVALFGASILVMGLNGWLRVRREVRFFEATRVRDHEMIGRSVAATAVAVWKSDGREPALETVKAVNEHFTRIQIGWRDRDQSWACAPTSGTAPTTCVVRDVASEPKWFTYVPVDVAGVRRGAIELSESATTEHIFTHEVWVETLETALALALLSAMLSYIMGQVLVGRPVRALTEKAQSIGRGDFAQPLMLRPGDELGWLGQEMNTMSERLVATLDQLRHADRLATVGTLASGVAHELGTPLNVVSARASMIESEETSLEENRESAHIIKDATDRMTKIIRQLMQFARRSGAQKAPRDLRQLTAEALEWVRPLAAKASVELALADGPEDPTGLVDGGQYQQVVTNLVMNAVHAMRDGGRVQVGLHLAHAHPPGEADKTKACICLTVDDEGAGIAPEDVAHIFEPFFTTKDVGEGTGLGLPVSYGIVHDHGGWITVESELGVGTRFTVFLPRGSA